MHKILKPILALSAALAASPAADAARPQAKSFRSDYAVTYLGLTIAKSNIVSTVDNDAYSIEGSLATAGLGAIFDDTKATLAVSGMLSAKGAVPTRAHTDYKHEKKSKQMTISFAKGNVVSTEVVPPPKPRAEDWIPVTQKQLRAVADPLSALLVPASSPEAVCAKPMKVYDGEMRLDLKLKHKKTEQIKIKGYEGVAVTCTASFVPVSGYRANKKSVKFMRDKGRISITFAPLGETGVYAPVRATVGTEMGTLTLQARRFEAIN